MSKLRNPARPSSDAKMCIIIWRAIALLIREQPLSLAVPLDWMSRRSRPISFIVVTDAGPLGIGVVVKLPNGVIVAKISYILPFKRRHETSNSAMEAKYQNCREFLGCIFAILCCHQLCSRHCHIKWINDNAAALTWAAEHKSTSRGAQWALFVFTWLQILSRIRIEEVEHIPGSSMGYVDDLSRFQPTPELDSVDDWSKKLPNDINRLISACDPTTSNQGQLLQASEAIPRIIGLVQACLLPWAVDVTSSKFKIE
jgi:hypothetical protein